MSVRCLGRRGEQVRGQYLSSPTTAMNLCLLLSKGHAVCCYSYGVDVKKIPWERLSEGPGHAGGGGVVLVWFGFVCFVLFLSP